MRKSSRRGALLLAVLALSVPSTLGLASMTAQSAPLCTPETGCKTPDSPDSTKNPKPSVPTKPDTPTEGPTDSPLPAPTTSPSPTDEPTESPSPTDEPTESPSPTEEPTEPVEATKDEDAPIFTDTPAAMGSESLSFKGLSGISIVDVPTIDGGTTRTLKIEADEIKISGFSLTVRPRGEEDGLLTKSDTMTLAGDVSVYIGSITGTTKDGHSLTLGTDTPPSMDDVKPGLLRVTMGLVGSTADSITYSNVDQKMKKA